MHAVIDLARAPHLHEHVARLSPGQAACLFEGKLDPEVVAASPHIVELDPNDPLTRLWLTDGWSQAWGILIDSPAPLMAVRRRMRHFTQARLPDGTGPVLFRFWDPRVFRTYFPLVERAELAEWFKEIDRFIVETEDGAGSIAFSLAGGGLLATPAGRPSPGII